MNKKVKKLTGIWTWLVSWSNSVMPEGYSTSKSLFRYCLQKEYYNDQFKKSKTILTFVS